MRLTTSSLALSCFLTLAACPGGSGDESGTGASTTTTTGPGTAGSTSGATGETTEVTTGATSGATSGTTATTGPGTTGPQTTGPGTTSEGTTSPETTTSEGTTSEGTTTEGASTSAATSEGSTTGGSGGGACQTDDDCKLHDDCCSCYGLPKDQSDPICKSACEQTKCEQNMIDQAVCRFGQCTTEKVKCSGEVACDALPPECPPGELPGHTDACWTGGCVPAASCDEVPDCALCPDGTMCVMFQAFQVKKVCEPVPTDCGGKPSCDCAGDLACEQPFGICNDGDGKEADLVCVCPTC